MTSLHDWCYYHAESAKRVKLIKMQLFDNIMGFQNMTKQMSDGKDVDVNPRK